MAIRHSTEGRQQAAMPLRVPILCVLLMVMEGLDSNIISYVGPLIRDEYHLSGRMLGAIYSATIIASLAGAAGLAPLSDRFGRKPLLVATSLVLSGCSLALPFVATAPGLIALRVVVGLAFGAAVPTTFALAADFAPDHRRALIVMLVTAGVALGYVLAGFATAAIVPAYGWRALVEAIAAASAIWTGIVFVALPETTGLRSGSDTPSREVERPSALTLLRAPHLRISLAIWLAVASVYAVEFMLGFWLPTLLMGQGYDVRAAGVLTAIGKIASIVGSLAMGWLMDRRGLRPVLAGGYALGAVGLTCLAFALGSPIFALPAILATCFFIDGSFSGAQALTVSSFPPQMRATAAGWITGFARTIGGGLGTMTGGALLDAGYHIGAMAALMCALMLLGAAAILSLHKSGTAAVTAALASATVP